LFQALYKCPQIFQLLASLNKILHFDKSFITFISKLKTTAMENLDLLNNDLQVSPASQNFLNETAKWGKFLAIVGFIFCGLMVIAAFFLPALLLTMPPYNQIAGATTAMASVFTIVYLILAVILFFPCLYLYRFSVKMKLALGSVSQENFETSLQNLKSVFKFYGIFTIVILSFYALIFVVTMLGLAMKG
jgi:hypothetical protein